MFIEQVTIKIVQTFFSQPGRRCCTNGLLQMLFLLGRMYFYIEKKAGATLIVVRREL